GIDLSQASGSVTWAAGVKGGGGGNNWGEPYQQCLSTNGAGTCTVHNTGTPIALLGCNNGHGLMHFVTGSRVGAPPAGNTDPQWTTTYYRSYCIPLP
ncbi:MAG: hypothetical protein AB7P04_11855, partial [Bacteriovoracia bacterium]